MVPCRRRRSGLPPAGGGRRWVGHEVLPAGPHFDTAPPDLELDPVPAGAPNAGRLVGEHVAGVDRLQHLAEGRLDLGPGARAPRGPAGRLHDAPEQVRRTRLAGRGPLLPGPDDVDGRRRLAGRAQEVLVLEPARRLSRPSEKRTSTGRPSPQRRFRPTKRASIIEVEPSAVMRAIASRRAPRSAVAPCRSSVRDWNATRAASSRGWRPRTKLPAAAFRNSSFAPATLDEQSSTSTAVSGASSRSTTRAVCATPLSLTMKSRSESPLTGAPGA